MREERYSRGHLLCHINEEQSKNTLKSALFTHLKIENNNEKHYRRYIMYAYTVI